MKISVDIILRCIGCSCINFYYIHVTCTYLRRYVRMYVRIYARMIACVYRILDCHFISLKTSRFFMGLFHPWTSIDHPCCRVFSCLKLSSSKFQDLAVRRKTPKKYKGTLEGTCPTKRLIPVTVQKGLKCLKKTAHLSKMQQYNSTALTLPFKQIIGFFASWAYLLQTQQAYERVWSKGHICSHSQYIYIYIYYIYIHIYIYVIGKTEVIGIYLVVCLEGVRMP